MNEQLISRRLCLLFIILIASVSSAPAPATFNSNPDDDAVIVPDDSEQCQGHHHHHHPSHHHHDDEGYEPWDEHMAKERIKAKFRARTSTDPATRKASEIEDEDELLDRMIEAHKARARKSKQPTNSRRRNSFYQDEDDDSPGLLRRIRKRLFRW